MKSKLIFILLFFNYVKNIKVKESSIGLNNQPEKEKHYFFIDNEFIIKINNQFSNEYERIIGNNGVISFQTDYNDKNLNKFNSSDIEEKSSFETIIIDNLKNEYKTKCRLFKPINDNLRLFCALKGNLASEASYINLNSTFFEYDKKYNISIISEIKNIPIIPVKGTVPFLYSDYQEIYIEDKKDLYNLIFKFEHYNNELLVLMGNGNQAIIIESCNKKGKELICPIKKTKIESIFGYNKKICNIGILYNNYGYYFPSDISNIILFYNNVTKKDIKVEIISLKENIVEMERYIVYETTNNLINDVVTENFNLNFFGKNKEEGTCFFKNNENTNLLLLCKPNFQGIYSLEKTNSEIKLNNIHIIYNFIIQPIKNSETFNVIYGFKYNLVINYPLILDFTKKDSADIILIHSTNQFPYEKIKLNIESDESLKCDNLEFVVKCKVFLSHFKNKQSGYFNLVYKNFMEGYSNFYEINPFKIIIPKKFIQFTIKVENNNNYIIIGQNGLLCLVTNYNDTENIFNIFEIDSYIFQLNFIDFKDNKIYKSDCNFWKALNENMRIFCKLENNFEIGEHNVYLNKTSFNYKNDYYIYLNSEFKNIKIKQLDTNISLLYSEKQVINIDNDINMYYLSIKQIFYDDKPLYLYKNDMKYLRLNTYRRFIFIQFSIRYNNELSDRTKRN